MKNNEKQNIDKKIDKKQAKNANSKKKKLTKDDKAKIEAFTENYKVRLSKKTFDCYIKILVAILIGTCKITCKSKYLQVKSVLAKCKAVGIAVEFLLLDWTRNQDKAIEINKSLTEGELEKALNEVPNSKKGLELKKAMEISFFTGLRLNEVLSLKAEDIEGNTIKVIGKGNKFRLAYIPQTKKELIENFKSFTISENYIMVTVNRISKRIGKPFSFHSLRHSFAINIVKKGGNISTLQKLLGHSNLATTSIYLRFHNDINELHKLGF